MFIEVTDLFSRRVREGEQSTGELVELETVDLSYPWQKMDYHH